MMMFLSINKEAGMEAIPEKLKTPNWTAFSFPYLGIMFRRCKYSCVGLILGLYKFECSRFSRDGHACSMTAYAQFAKGKYDKIPKHALIK